jgi:hypothetical protein
MRWYLVVQARRLLDAGYTGKDAADRLGIHPASITRWKSDPELWEAAFKAPDHEAVGPPKKTTSTALQTLQAATAHAAKREAPHAPADTQHAEHRGPEPRRGTDTSKADTSIVDASSNSDSALVKNGTSNNGNGLGYLAPHQRDEPQRGRYDGLTGTKVGERTAHHEARGDALDVTAELALTRGLLERMALAVEHDDAVDLEVVDRLARLLDQVSKMVQRVEQIRAADAISRKDFMRFCGELGRALRQYCTPEQARQVAEHMMSLKV